MKGSNSAWLFVALVVGMLAGSLFHAIYTSSKKTDYTYVHVLEAHISATDYAKSFTMRISEIPEYCETMGKDTNWHHWDTAKTFISTQKDGSVSIMVVP